MTTVGYGNMRDLCYNRGFFSKNNIREVFGCVHCSLGDFYSFHVGCCVHEHFRFGFTGAKGVDGFKMPTSEERFARKSCVHNHFGV